MIDTAQCVCGHPADDHNTDCNHRLCRCEKFKPSLAAAARAAEKVRRDDLYAQTLALLQRFDDLDVTDGYDMGPKDWAKFWDALRETQLLLAKLQIDGSRAAKRGVE